MDLVLQIRRISNGFIATTQEGEEHFLKHFNLEALLLAVDQPTEADHELALRKMVLNFPVGHGKIPAIKAVREYCATHKFDRYYGLKDAKDYVESLRDSEYWRGYPLESDRM